MTFTSGAIITPTIVDTIANGLIATPEGRWTDADPTWNTTVKTGNSARRALKYYDGIETIYLALEVINTSTDFYYGNQGWWYKGKGIRVVFSSTWDSTGHIYTGSIQTSFMAFEVCPNCAVSADFATMLVTYWLWYDTNGFVIMGKPEPTGDTNQQSFIIVVERNPNKRYVDVYSTFYTYMVGNMWPELYDGNWVADTKTRSRSILRPFAYQFPDYTGGGSWGSWAPNGNGISFSPLPTYYAYKSAGNGKVYYMKPIIHNQANQLAPIFTGESFFLWTEGLGLIDGDVVAIQGQATKFLCKGLDSPDSTSRLTYAIRYL